MKYNLWYSAGKDQHASIDWDSPPRAILKAMLSKQPMTDSIRNYVEQFILMHASSEHGLQLRFQFVLNKLCFGLIVSTSVNSMNN